MAWTEHVIMAGISRSINGSWDVICTNKCFLWLGLTPSLTSSYHAPPPTICWVFASKVVTIRCKYCESRASRLCNNVRGWRVPFLGYWCRKARASNMPPPTSLWGSTDKYLKLLSPMGDQVCLLQQWVISYYKYRVSTHNCRELINTLTLSDITPLLTQSPQYQW